MITGGCSRGSRITMSPPHHFTMLVERQVKGAKVEEENSPTSYPSLLGHAVRQSMNNPLYRLVRRF